MEYSRREVCGAGKAVGDPSGIGTILMRLFWFFVWWWVTGVCSDPSKVAGKIPGFCPGESRLLIFVHGVMDRRGLSQSGDTWGKRKRLAAAGQ